MYMYNTVQQKYYMHFIRGGRLLALWRKQKKKKKKERKKERKYRFDLYHQSRVESIRKREREWRVNGQTQK